MSTIPSLSPIDEQDDDYRDVVARLVYLKHRQYNRRASFSCFTYYATRTVAGLAAGFLPFAVKSYPTIAAALSMSIVIAIVVDSVYRPGDKWKTFSKASALLTVAELQAKGLYEEAKQMIDIIQATEAQGVAELGDLQEILQKIKKASLQ